MLKTKESPKATLSALTIELANPRITASAQEAMHPPDSLPQRGLVIIDGEPFHGYACSWCGCRFPDANVLNDKTLLETLINAREQREKHFVDHVCSR